MTDTPRTTHAHCAARSWTPTARRPTRASSRRGNRRIDRLRGCSRSSRACSVPVVAPQQEAPRLGLACQAWQMLRGMMADRRLRACTRKLVNTR
jgi:hypothetical protein